MRLSGSSFSVAITAPRILIPKASKFSIPEGVFSFTPRRRWLCLTVSCTSGNLSATTASSQNASRLGDLVPETQRGTESLSFEVRSPSSPPSLIPRPVLSLSDQAFLLLAFIGCTVFWFRLRRAISLTICLESYLKVCLFQVFIYLLFKIKRCWTGYDDDILCIGEMQTSIAFSCLVAAAVPTLFVSILFSLLNLNLCYQEYTYLFCMINELILGNDASCLCLSEFSSYGQ